MGLDPNPGPFQRNRSPTRKLRYGNDASDGAAVLQQDLAKPPKLYPADWKVLGCPLDHVTQTPCPDELMGLLQALILKSHGLVR